MNDEKNYFFGNSNKYIDVDDPTIILDDDNAELIIDDNVNGSDDKTNEEVEASILESFPELTNTSNAQDLIEKKESNNEVEVIDTDELFKEEEKKDEEPIVELLSDEELKPKTNETLYKMIVETLDDDQKLINIDTKKDSKKDTKKEGSSVQFSCSVVSDSL